jgi:protein-S-isoprenylcysteine O-methyltransferase Ste14
MSDIDSDTPPPQASGVWWVVVQGVIFGFFVIAMVAGERVEPFTGMVYAQSAGLFVALVGSWISIWSVMQHGSALSAVPVPREGARLITTGPYRYVRHPMYTGVIAFVLGASVAYMVPAAMVAAPTFFVFFLAKSGREEELLAQFVPGYRTYRSEVRWRLIPRVI